MEIRKEDWLVVLGTAHRRRDPGKHSPDGKLLEYLYSREIVAEVALKLREYGYKVEVDYEPEDLPKNMQSTNCKTERNRELAMRVNYVNELCRQNGKNNVIYVSIHVDASPPVDNKWHNANGWSVRVSNKASENSKRLAGCLFDAAEEHKLKTRKPAKDRKYWSQSLKVLNDTVCPAVLTENLFQDNQEDVEYLLSDEGRHVIERIHVEGILRYIGKENLPAQ